jgi:hypothetical protein
LEEYATTVEEHVSEMASRFAEIDAKWESGPANAGRAQSYWDSRLDIRHDFLASIRGLTPPPVVESSHLEAIELFTRITEADEALAARVASTETITDHWQWVDTPEGVAADAVLAEVYEYCRSSQADFDATAQGGAFEGMPWLPSEMSKVIKVSFGCPP